MSKIEKRFKNLTAFSGVVAFSLVVLKPEGYSIALYSIFLFYAIITISLISYIFIGLVQNQINGEMRT